MSDSQDHPDRPSSDDGSAPRPDSGPMDAALRDAAFEASPAAGDGAPATEVPPALALDAPDEPVLPPSAPLSAALSEVWRIAWPTVLTMTSYTVMQFMDKLMMGQVGPLELSAQGNGGIWAFVPIGIALGFLTVVNTYVSQNLGAGRPENGPKYAWGAIWMAVGIWLCAFIPLALLMPLMFQSMQGMIGAGATEVTTPAEAARLITLQSAYGQILLMGAIFTIAGRGLHHFFFGMHWPKIVTISAIFGNVVNVVCNYVLIFGSEGIPGWGIPGVPGVPALGIYGAAIATILGGFVEFIIPLAIFLGPKLNRELKTRASWQPRMQPIRDLWRIGWPAASQYGNEIICWAIFMSLLVGYFGTAHTTAGWIALSYMHLSFMPAVGFSVAVTSLVGKYIGAGRPDIAMARARLGLAMALVYMSTCALIFFIFRYPLVEVFIRGDLDPETAEQIVEIGALVMICAAVFQTLDAVGIVYTGALRGAGDTVWPGVVTMIYSWLFIVGLGAAMVWYVPQLESIGPWIGASFFIILYGITMGWRFESGSWKSIKLLDDLESHGNRQQPVGPGAVASIPGASVRDIAEDIAETYSRP